MGTIVVGLSCLFIGFVIGFLVFRNNQKKMNDIEKAVTK